MLQTMLDTRWGLAAAVVLVGCTPSGPCFDERCRPDDLAPFVATTLDPDRSVMATGQVLITQLDEGAVSYAAVIDGEGAHRWWFAPPDPATGKLLRSRLSRDGSTVLLGVQHPDESRTEGALLQVDRLTSELLAEVAVEDNHHDHVELADGRIAYLSRWRVPDEWFGTDFLVSTDTVRVTSLDGSSPDEVVIDLLELVGRPAWTCSHAQPNRRSNGKIDWSHANSLVAHPDSGDLTLGVRHFDAVARFDATGSLRWWLGSPPGWPSGFGVVASRHPDELVPLDGAQPPRHGHFGESWQDGLLVFDNGNHGDRPTRIVEYAIDEAARTYRETWSWEHPEGLTFGARGDAIRLPGGNVLVAWTATGEIWEVTREGEVVWQAISEHKVLRLQFVEDW